MIGRSLFLLLFFIYKARMEVQSVVANSFSNSVTHIRKGSRRVVGGNNKGGLLDKVDF